MYNNYGAYGAMQRELQSDAWIQRNVPGGLNSPLGRQLDNYLGGNPNPTLGQRGYGGGYPGYGSSYGYGYQQQYRGW